MALEANPPCPICAFRQSMLAYPDTLGEQLPRIDYGFTPGHKQTYKIIKCLFCYHHFAVNLPDNFWTGALEATKDSHYLSLKEQRLRTAKEALNVIKRFKSSGQLLDIGCATGDFLSEAQKDFQVFGSELSQYSSKIAKDTGFEVYTTVLEKIPKDQAFDVLTLWGVIQYFEDPNFNVKQMLRLLKPEGIVCVWTGDVRSFPARFLKRNWWYILGQHIHVYSKKSLRLLFEKNGFKTIHSKIYPYIMTKKSMLNSLGRYPFLRWPVSLWRNSKFLNNLAFKIRVPGELFFIFQKENT